MRVSWRRCIRGYSEVVRGYGACSGDEQGHVRCRDLARSNEVSLELTWYSEVCWCCKRAPVAY